MIRSITRRHVAATRRRRRTLRWMINLLLLILFFLSISNAQAPQETIITDFEKPEDLYDLQGTPYILVSEFNGGNRSISTTISLLETPTLKRLPLREVAPSPPIQQSIFADPTCIPLPFGLLGAHGIDARPSGDAVGSRAWEVAVVNHYARESIEFYMLNPGTRTVASMGCVDLTENGDLHNDVSFAPEDGTRTDDVLVVSLWFETFFGIAGMINLISSFLIPIPGITADGSVLLIGPGGDYDVLRDNLNANGLWFANDNQLFVAETTINKVRVINPQTGELDLTVNIPVKTSPDNLVRFSDIEFLVTRIDSPFLQTGLCFLGIAEEQEVCNVAFSVLRYNLETLNTEVIYSRAADALPSYRGIISVALFKDGFLYVGNSGFDNLLQIRINL